MRGKHTQQTARGEKAYRRSAMRVKRSPPVKRKAEKVLSALPCGIVIGAMVCGVAHLINGCFRFTSTKEVDSEPPPYKARNKKRVRFEGIDDDDSEPSAPPSPPSDSSEKSLAAIESRTTTSNSSMMPSRTAPIVETTLPIARIKTIKRKERSGMAYQRLESARTTSSVSAPPPPSAPPAEQTAQPAGEDFITRERTIRSVKALNNLRLAAAEDRVISSTTYRPRISGCPDIIITAPASPAPTDTVELVHHMKRRESVCDENGNMRSGLPIQRKLKASYRINRRVPGLVCGRADCFGDETKKAIARTPFPEGPEITGKDDEEDCISLLSLSD